MTICSRASCSDITAPKGWQRTVACVFSGSAQNKLVQPVLMPIFANQVSMHVVGEACSGSASLSFPTEEPYMQDRHLWVEEKIYAISSLPGLGYINKWTNVPLICKSNILSESDETCHQVGTSK